MEGKIIEDVVCDGIMGYVHSQFYAINRIIVDGIVITVNNNQLYAIKEEEFTSQEYVFVKNVEVPDDIIKEIKDYMRMKEKMVPVTKEIEKLLC